MENLGIGLSKQGKKVLLIDADPQASLTISLGYPQPDDLEPTLSDLLNGTISENPVALDEVLIHQQEGIDLIPSNISLVGLEVSLVNTMNRERILKQFLETLREDYDYILLDCVPSLGMLTVNALTAANTVLVPIQCEFFALDGLSQLVYTIELIRKNLNRLLTIEGVVFTMFDSRTNLSVQVVENVKENLKQHIYNTVIPRNVRLAEAPSYGMPIIEYDPRSAGAEHYMMLADEVIENDYYR